MATITHRPLEVVALQALSNNLPDLPTNLPKHLVQELEMLNQLSDDELWNLMTSRMNESQQTKYTQLLHKNSLNQLSKRDEKHMDALYETANHLTLRKAYAGVLLKWRGHRLPTLAELEETVTEPE